MTDDSYSPADLARAVQAERDRWLAKAETEALDQRMADRLNSLVEAERNDWVVKSEIEAANRRMTERYESIQRQFDESRQLMFGAPEAAPEVQAEDEVHEEPKAESAPEPEAEAHEPEADGPALINAEFVKGLDQAQYARYREQLGPGRARVSNRGIFG